ncbi:cuticle protein 7-like [Panulirus ornatus]|uniref:cuticle protein 7-like n=1 Tax=Panulirus ornatus TaxID=150431 RepID=UPI003A84E4AD
MFYQVLLALVVVAATTADPGDYGHSYPSGYMPYHFNYGVSDHYKATDFGQHENSDGKNVWGTYWVNLPDGRKQRVDYTADHYKGYVAKVSYYGKAHHPKHYGPPATFFKHHGYGHGYGH